MTTIELNDKDATLFRALMEGGVFDTKNGKVILNFDSESTLTEIRKDIVIYKRVASKKEVLVL